MSKTKTKRKSTSRKNNGPATSRSAKSTTPTQVNHRNRMQVGCMVVGFVAIALASIWNHIDVISDDNIMNDTTKLLQIVQKSSSFKLKQNRTLVAVDNIPSQSVLMEIPRELMIWDLDAVRNDFIRTELLPNNNIQGTVAKRAAILSAYLALLRNDSLLDQNNTMQLQASVAKQLPSYQEYKSFHPVLANINRMQTLLGKHSLAFLELVALRKSLHDEYDSFLAASDKFASLVSREDYITCRLAVQSRAFQIPGILPESEIPEEEQNEYTSWIQIDFKHDGVLSIEVVNDWMNSHINNNVMVGGYDAVKRKGRAWSTKTILPGQELIMDYGRFHDYVLFGQYGYVPSDGTGVTVTSVAAYHNINGPLPELAELQPYLQFDHGYPDCIKKDLHPSAFRLKELKARYLREIAIDTSRWALPLPPRVTTDITPRSTVILPDDYQVPFFDADIYEFLETHVLSISLPCRLVALTENDVDDAESLLLSDIETLKLADTPLDTPSLKLEELQVSPELMVRTIHCMRMMASVQKEAYETTIDEKVREITKLANQGQSSTLEFNAAHVTLGEMQSLEILENWAVDVLMSVAGLEGLSPDDLEIRSEPC